MLLFLPEFCGFPWPRQCWVFSLCLQGQALPPSPPGVRAGAELIPGVSFVLHESSAGEPSQGF